MARPSAEADLAHCAALIRNGSRSFHAASLLLPRQVCEPAFALYAFCRVADDAVDIEGRADAVDRLAERLDRAYAGRPAADPVDRAFTAVIEAHDIPRAIPEALLEGLAWDAAGRSCETLSDVTAYSARVAATVGVMMACLMGARDRHRLARAADLGVAMQFTNIARDIGEDARAGRLYLPREWLCETGLDAEAWLADPRPCPEIAALTRRLLAEAATLYRRADSGIAALPTACQPAIFAARHIYAAIGERIAAAGHDSVTTRAVVPGPSKVIKAARGFASAALPRARLTEAPLPETAFLIEAAQSEDTSSPALFDRVVWTIDLFTELERRDRTARGDLPQPG